MTVKRIANVMTKFNGGHKQLEVTNALFQNCPKNMHNLVLGCLLDLCENTKAIPHVGAWRGKDDTSAAHLFCDIWRREEQDIGVARHHTGAISGKVFIARNSSLLAT